MKERVVKIEDSTYRASSNGYIINKQGRPLVGSENGKGYCQHQIKINNRVKSYYTARLIYEAFNGKIPEGLEIDHIDGDPRNNKLENLRAVTHKENMNNPVTKARMKGHKRRFQVMYEKIG